MHAMLKDIFRANRRGKPQGVYAVCTVNRYAIQTALRQARRDQWPVSIEATAQQVNPEGGYSGMTPSGFAAMVHREAAVVGLDARWIVLGGDHAGPHPWATRTAPGAMGKARELVQAQVAGGFTKLHIDTTTPCRHDPREDHGALPMALIVSRTVDLMAVAEEAARRLGVDPPFYVVGSEVPSPGGTAHPAGCGPISAPEEIKTVMRAFRQALEVRGLVPVLSRVTAIVARTGADFSSRSIQPYDAAAARHLVPIIDALPGLVLEAHSTDYQTPRALKDMVAGRVAILKVGPWLTYTFRETILDLERIERIVLQPRKSAQRSRLAETMEAAMIGDPRHWQRHYRGSAPELKWLRRYSYADRIRYYWHYPGPAAAIQRLMANLRRYPPPRELIGKYLPAASRAMADGRCPPEPEDLIRFQIGRVIDHYAAACGARA